MLYKLSDGENVKTELTNIALLNLRSDQPEAYKNYYAAFKRMGDSEKMDAIFDPLTIIYTAYLCAESGERMSYEKFVERAPFDVEHNVTFCGELIAAKKGQASAKPLKGQRKSAGAQT